jgi:hypothetical protein
LVDDFTVLRIAGDRLDPMQIHQASCRRVSKASWDGSLSESIANAAIKQSGGV